MCKLLILLGVWLIVAVFADEYSEYSDESAESTTVDNRWQGIIL